MAEQERQRIQTDEADSREGAGGLGTPRKPGEVPKHGTTRRFEEGGPADRWDPDTTSDGAMGGGGAGGAGGVTGGASGRTNNPD
ncbi:hypothetical protein [Paracraurococcus lichenis]|uniref:Uncharacterized protein n=1 Tax=Paracraurococcus lichenis TaxID=3064888 RepID=A0ABT9E0B1_9PROT|nr:hypothetical protein [Paracraurococcus sp. LOR1-02]MDO9709550.1 hypothetical protein [Paracraurococcus sp. LOR1-02]